MTNSYNRSKHKNAINIKTDHQWLFQHASVSTINNVCLDIDRMAMSLTPWTYFHHFHARALVLSTQQPTRFAVVDEWTVSQCWSQISINSPRWPLWAFTDYSVGWTRRYHLLGLVHLSWKSGYYQLYKIKRINNVMKMCTIIPSFMVKSTNIHTFYEILTGEFR